MRVLVTGANGQLGHDICKELNKRNIECIGSDILLLQNSDAMGLGKAPGTEISKTSFYQCDITNSVDVEDMLNSVRPDAVIHCAAWTSVDAAEDENNKPKVYSINVEGTRNLVDACKKCTCKMMYISTDYVFDGSGITPWGG